MTKVEEDLWQQVPPVAPRRGWYPDPPKLRYWTGEAWTDDIRLAGPPSPGTRVEEALQRGEGSGPWPWRNGLRVVSETPVGEERAAEGVVPQAPVASESWVTEEAGAETAQSPEEALQSPEEAPSSEEDEHRLVRELAKFALVALLAVAAGALVAVVGIVLTV